VQLHSKSIGLVAAIGILAGPTWADPDNDQLTINDEIAIVTETAAPEHMDYVSTIYSGWRFRSDETQAFQMDDFDNPGMLGVENAMVAWAAADGSEGKSCASCHENPEDMAGVRAVYPKWNEERGEVTTIEMEVNNCRESRMGAETWKYDGGEMTDMVALLSAVSRGMPVNVAIDGPAQSTWEQGKELYPGSAEFVALELYVASRGNGLSVEGPSVRN